MNVLLERRGRTAGHQPVIPRQTARPTDRPAPQQRAKKRQPPNRNWLIGLGVFLVVVLAFAAMWALTMLAGGTTYLR